MTSILIEDRPHHRTVLLRKAILYTPSGVVATGLFLLAFFNLVTGNVGAIFAAILLGLIAFAVDFEALGSIRDLRGEPVTTEGPVLRSWTKARIAIFGHVHYLLLARRVFEVNAVTALEVSEGDRVRVMHWPHTNTVISVHRLPAVPVSTTPAP